MIIILFFFVCSLYPLAAQSSGKRILLYPMAGKGVTADEAKSISNDIRTNLINEGYTFAADPGVVLKMVSDKQKIGEDVKELGKIYSTNFIMPCTLDKINQTFKINCEIYHKIKVENGNEEWESWAGTGIVKYGKSLEDLSKQITNTKDKESSIVERIKVEENASKNTSCRNVDATYFMEGLGDCSDSVKRSKDDFLKCAEKENRTFCGIGNKSQTCIASCRENARSLLVYLFLQAIYKTLQEKVDQCHAKGNYYNYDFEKKSCEYANPSEVAEKEAKAKKDCESKAPDYYWLSASCKLTDAAAIRLKKECEEEGRKWQGEYCSNPPLPDHEGWASLIIPGMGLVLKNRPLWGTLFFGATVGAYSDYSSKLQAYKDSREEYRAFVPVPLPLNFGTTGNYLYFEMRYQAFKNSAEEATSAANMLGAIYITQVIMSYAIEADYKFFSFLDFENKNRLAYNFNIKRDSSFGVPNSSGTYYTFSLTWGF